MGAVSLGDRAAMQVRRAVVVVVCAALSLSTGCSVATVRTLPPNYRDVPHFRCTSNKIAPGLDLLWGLGGLVGGAVALSTWKSRTGKIVGAADLIGGAMFLASSAYGFSKTSECAKALDAADEREAARVRGDKPGPSTAAKPTPPPTASPAAGHAPQAATPNAEPQPTSAPLGCQYDTQCKGDRICHEGRCVDPDRAPAPAPEPTSTP